MWVYRIKKGFISFGILNLTALKEKTDNCLLCVAAGNNFSMNFDGKFHCKNQILVCLPFSPPIYKIILFKPIFRVDFHTTSNIIVFSEN